MIVLNMAVGWMLLCPVPLPVFVVVTPVDAPLVVTPVAELAVLPLSPEKPVPPVE